MKKVIEPDWNTPIKTQSSIKNLTVKGNPQNINNINQIAFVRPGKYTDTPPKESTLLVLALA